MWARVVSLSHAELIELYEIRESLEGMACRLAAERMTEAEIDELRQVSTPMSATPRSRPGRLLPAGRRLRLPLPDHSGPATAP
jgi:DNA-binding GntR family transcriptional regulator